jgi:8-oxo-dGTP pyrophosphatase MutT (NUDIX family)
MSASPIPAATVVIMRESANTLPELLMVERAAAMRFAGGAMVFPGGRVDPGDRALAALHPGDIDDNSGRIAAIRETIEEAGIAVGLRRTIDIAAIRAALAAGAALGDLIAPADLDLERLVPFARWLPHIGVSHRIFDTRFYLARLPDGAPSAVADGGESVRLLWTSASDAIADAKAGRSHVIFPTRRNLDRLARFASYDAAVADANAFPTDTITPWIEERDGEPHLCIPEGRGYPVTSQPVREALRG